MFLNRVDLEVGQQLAPLTKTITKEKIDLFESVGTATLGNGSGQSGPVNIHTDPQKAAERGLTEPVASGQMSFAYLHELVARRFGMDFRQGGDLTVTFLKPVYSGDVVTIHGAVSSKDVTDGRTSLVLEVWVENHREEKTAVGTAKVTVPSPLT